MNCPERGKAVFQKKQSVPKRSLPFREGSAMFKGLKKRLPPHAAFVSGAKPAIWGKGFDVRVLSGFSDGGY